MKRQVVSLSRRLNGYKGRIRRDLTKLDHNFTTLGGNPASLNLLETVRRYFEVVFENVQKARELYIETMGLIPTEEWDAEWARKSDELEADMEKAEKMMEKAERDHANAMKDLPVPAPGPVPRIKGNTPMIVDKLVISIGLNRIAAASNTATSIFFPSFLN